MQAPNCSPLNALQLATKSLTASVVVACSSTVRNDWAMFATQGPKVSATSAQLEKSGPAPTAVPADGPMDTASSAAATIILLMTSPAALRIGATYRPERP